MFVLKENTTKPTVFIFKDFREAVKYNKTELNKKYEVVGVHGYYNYFVESNLYITLDEWYSEGDAAECKTYTSDELTQAIVDNTISECARIAVFVDGEFLEFDITDYVNEVNEEPAEVGGSAQSWGR